ncbi:hypothetical protein COU96_03015 [Candidatus Shapirobacteria bacterium CG10_big_fil_rev_8_21_14_0_10_38_14]|uniref:Metallo-beta-lactamase domain-containing protein n=1 Tax=Candidatus Shapirobacteria bacterium CG10_big_fil_rev_8_21_14_0_10_38_14 TaxID=1974483 RepID=A0A2M8L4R8_9BACT|nr:MAG: hypothetical protein COU96_03015 [Candidatus Shapirobacteria bacterium CG10_big_fil_rev_8_21_14_0_10_38_14]
MDSKKTKIFLIGLILLAGLIWATIFQLPDSRLHLIFCDVGQGDAILVTHRSNQILIDGGPDNRVLSCLANHMPFWDREIELVILTHPEADHLTGLIDVIKRYDITQFVVNSVVNDSAGFWEFRETVLAEAASVHSPQAKEEIKIGPLGFKVLWPRHRRGDSLVWSHFAKASRDRQSVLGVASPPSDINETSIVLQLAFGKFNALLTGDIGFDTEEKLDLANLPGIEVLKVPHHGSKYSSGEEFLAKLNPELAVISVGKNRWGHPTEEVLNRLLSVGAKVLRTDQDGEVEIVSDGKNWYYKPK